MDMFFVKTCWNFFRAELPTKTTATICGSVSLTNINMTVEYKTHARNVDREEFVKQKIKFVLNRCTKYLCKCAE